MRINEMVRKAHDNSKAKGWWDDFFPRFDDAGNRIADATEVDPEDLMPDTIAAKLCLVHSEVSEALEAVRDGELRLVFKTIDSDDERIFVNKTDEPYSPKSKPDGLPAELADVVIRIGDLCGALGIDLEEAVQAKMTYNATRPQRHGGKAL
jgi:NTP pyrophosphatase (non-canonical NTP hydrolase)